MKFNHNSDHKPHLMSLGTFTRPTPPKQLYDLSNFARLTTETTTTNQGRITIIGLRITITAATLMSQSVWSQIVFSQSVSVLNWLHAISCYLKFTTNVQNSQQTIVPTFSFAFVCACAYAFARGLSMNTSDLHATDLRTKLWPSLLRGMRLHRSA